MNDIVVVARATARAGKEEEVKRAFLAAVEPTHGESGCLRYAFHRVSDDPQKFVMIERWSSRDDLDRHLASPHIARLFAALEGLLLEKTEITILEPLSDDTGARGRL